MLPGDPTSPRRSGLRGQPVQALILAAILSTALWSCSDDEATNPPAPHEADLVVVRFSPIVPDYLVKPGDQIYIGQDWLAENAGDATAGAFGIGYYLSADNAITNADALMDTLACPGLAPSNDFEIAKQVAIPPGTASGTWYVGVLLDRNGDVPESNEANNARSFRIEVTTLPDLVVYTTPLFNPAFALPGAQVFINSWALPNNGTTPSAPCEYGYYLSTDQDIDTLDIHLGGGIVPAIPARSFSPLEATSFLVPQITPGAYYLGVLVDQTGVIEEYKETNNEASAPFQVQGLADLVITSGPITAVPTSVVAGESVAMSAGTIENIGEPINPNISPFVNGFFLSTDALINTSDTFLGEAVGNDPYQWQAASVQIPANTPPGSYHIGVLVDRTLHIGESNETNNYVSTPITVEP